MPLVDTDAIVLHAFDYLESSRIVRLATRDAGVQSLIAKGARRPRGKFGTALDLFAEGSAHFSLRPGRELHTLASFDVTRVRTELAADLARFSAASAIAELMLRFGNDEVHPELFTLLASVLDTLAVSSAVDTRAVALGGAWRLVATFGFAPSLEQCARCFAALDDAEATAFSHREGGALCATCARGTPGLRTLPAAARRTIAGWLADGAPASPDEATLRAHQRLLREFVQEHLADGRPLRAWDSWEKATWTAG